MTDFRIEKIPFNLENISKIAKEDGKTKNWPVVYTLNNDASVYVGESLNVAARFRNHIESTGKNQLHTARVVIDETFNKSACLDLESFLIRLFAGDGAFQVTNRNEGITNSDYFGRAAYQKKFEDIFYKLKEDGLFRQSIPEIVNSDLFKLSPFKELDEDQTIAVAEIVEGLFEDIENNRKSITVIQGAPGTGKTVVAIFLMKLLMDIKNADSSEPVEGDSVFSDFFVPGYPEHLSNFKIGMIIPQQALRTSIRKVFKKTPGLKQNSVMSPFEAASSGQRFDLLVIDEAHRLSQRANQPSPALNTKYSEINKAFFGHDDVSFTQLDWLKAISDHQIFLLDLNQSVRPADLKISDTMALVEAAKSEHRLYRLKHQHRVKAGEEWETYVRNVLEGKQSTRIEFENYDVRFFDDFPLMQEAIMEREAEEGLSRIVAGFAWPWISKNNQDLFDIEIDGVRTKWNTQIVDWVSSPNSVNEVGSIHTVQGYDLNYVGVIIGNDLRFDPARRKLFFDRSNYFDKRGMWNNKAQGITYSDDDIFPWIQNIYSVLLTRGVKGVYLYVCDSPLREYLRNFF